MRVNVLSAVVPLLAVLWLGGSSARAQSLLLRYGFDDSAATDSGSLPSANGTVVPGSTGAGFTALTPSGTGRAFNTGNGGGGTDAGYITTGSIAAPDSGDVTKLDGLQSLTMTTWLNLQGAPGSTSVPDRLMSDGGVNIGGFDFGVMGSSAGAINLVAFARNATAGVSTNTGTNTVDANNKWVFLAVTYDGTLTTANVRFYTGTTSTGVTQLGAPHTLNVGTLGDNTVSFQVAGTAESTSDRTPPGFLDDARVYSGAADVTFLEGVRASNVPEPSSAFALSAAALTLLPRRRLRRTPSCPP